MTTLTLMRPGGRRAIQALLLTLPATLALAGAGLRAAHHEPFLPKALGDRAPQASLTRQPAKGVHVAISRGGYSVRHGSTAVGLAGSTPGGPWTRFTNGAERTTPFGRETVVVGPRTTEQFLTVQRHQGTRTWRWRLRSGALTPRLNPNGSVAFSDGAIAGVAIEPARILLPTGRDVTPDGLQWSLERRTGAWWLTLRVDDSKLPVPYVIDPAITLRGVVGANNGAGAATITESVPAGVAANDFMLALVSVHGGASRTITAPGGWTLLRRENQGNNIADAIYYRTASSSEPASYQWTFNASDKASGGIIAYTGIDLTNPIDTSSGGVSSANGSTVTAPSVTTSADNARVVGFFGMNKNGTFTAPAGMTERWDQASGNTSSEAADYTQTPAGVTGAKTATSNQSNAWVGQLVALTLDINPPTAPALTVSESSADSYVSGTTLWYRPSASGATFTVDATASDAESGMQKVTFPGLSGGFTPSTSTDDTASPYSLTYTWPNGGSDSGSHNVTAVDNAGNTSSTPFTVTPDPNPPTTTDSAGSIGSSWKNTSQTVTLTPADGGGESGLASTYYTTDGSTPTLASTQGTSVSLTSNGTYTVKYFSTDRVANQETVRTAGTQIRIDKTAPSSATLNALPGTITNGQALTGTGTDALSGVASISYYECAGSSCTPSTLIGSSSTGPSYSVTWNSQPVDGTYQVLAHVSDAAGNGLDSAKQTVTINNAPVTTITAGPANPTNSANASFSFSAPGAVSYQCQLDGGGYSACTSPKAYTSLAAGSHTFQVRGIDGIGNVGQPASSTWTIDLTAPDTSITSTPANPTNATGASFSFTATEPGSTFECQLDGGGWSACTSPKAYAGLSGGSHTFQARATDPAGNTDGTPAGFTWTVDLTPPDTSITSTPANPTNLTSASFAFTSTEPGSTFECRLDGGAWSSCASPKSYSGLAAGSHTVDVRATDNVGNTDASPASFTWTVDLTAPDTSITSTPANPTNATGASFSFTATEPGSTFECQLDGAGWAACTSPRSYAALAAGSHTVQVRATDTAGNTDSTPASFTWTVDLTAPDTSITSTPANPTNTTSASFSFTATEGGSAFECRIDGGAWTGCTSPKSYSGLAAGSHTVDVRATDPAGNTDASPASFTWVVDLTAPDTAITSSPADPTNAASASFSFTSTEGGSTFACQLDGGGFLPCTSPKLYLGLAAGSHTVDVRATDPAGNTDASPASFTWTIDITPPDTSITSTPANPTNATGASLSFTATEPGSTFECQLDGAGWAACTSPRSYASLAAGSHTFQVRATDPAGNTDPTPASFSWTIDTTPPDTSITSTPANPTASTSASFSFSATEGGSTFECQLDGGGWAACTSPRSYSALAGASHTFQVRATDPAGNTDATPASFTWVVDLTAPDTSITSSPANPTNSTGATFAFTSTEGGSTFECQLDGGGFSSCTSPKTYTGLAAGSHTFDVRSTDSVGNTDATPASVTWTVDLTGPDTSITSAPADPTNATSASFSFTSTAGGATFECRLDGGSWAACTSPKSYSGLSAGSHTVDVRSTDTLNNTDLSPASYSWNIDLTAPDTSITSSPANPTNSTGASFSFTSTEGGSTFECQLDGGVWAACTSPQAYSGLSAGSHTVQLRATDPAGNTDATPASFTWTVDLTAPDTSITAGPANPSSSTNATLSFTATEGGSTFECQLDGAGFLPCSSPTLYLGLAAGSHTVDVRATDLAGNTDASPASFTWTIDTTPPDTSITSAPADPTNATSASFSFTATEPGSTFECRLDGGAWAACTSPKSYSGLTAGSHSVDVRATDPAGNTDGSPASYAWIVDVTAPDTSITATPANPSSSAAASFTFTASEPGSTFECRLDGGTWGPCTSPASYAGLAAGSHTVQVRATDAAGNTDATPASFTWTIDLTAPDTTITSGPADPTNAASASFAFTSTEGGSTFECQLDGAGFLPCTSPKLFVGLAAGSHTVDVRATDGAGNTDPTPDSFTWTIDTTAPDTSILSSPANPTSSTNASFSFDSTEPGSTFECQLDGGGWAACTSPRLYAALAAGSHTVQVRATDPAGNTDGSPASYAWTIDTTPPDTSITSTPANPTASTSASFSFTATEPGATFECRLDGGAWAACTSPLSLTGLTSAAHTVDVRATDPAGNTDPTPATFAWVVDLTPPDTTITSAPASPTNATDATVAFTSTEPGSTFECQLDGGGFSSCTSPQTYTGLAAGSHTVDVRATDSVGNTDPAPASVTWTIDLSAPDTSITSGPAAQTNSTAATFAFTATQPGSTFECQLDGGGFTACTSPRTFTSLGAGTHTFQVRATDTAGNTDPVPATQTWTVDTTPPNTSVDSGPSNPTASTGAVLTFSSTEPGSSFECQLDGAGFSSCTSPQSYAGLSGGGHTFQVRATDPAGNLDGSPATFSWTIDTAAPTASVDSGPASPTGATAATFSFSANEPGSTFECKLDGGGFASCSTPATYSGLGGGAHTFQVRATDAVGNVGAPASYGWTVDLTPPDTSIASQPADPTSATGASFTFTSTEPGSTFECQLDGGGYSACTSPRSYSALSGGTHTFQVRATDAVGNTDPSAATDVWTIDATAPTATVDFGPADPTAQTTAGLQFSASEPGSTFECQLDGAGYAACTSPVSYAGLAEGLHVFRVKAMDAVGNVGAAATASWHVDLTGPDAVVDSGPADPTNATSAAFAFSASEPGSSFQCQLDGAGYSSCASPRNVGGLAPGQHTFQVRATDALGNPGSPTSYTWTVDTTAPTAGLDDPGAVLRGVVTLSGTATDANGVRSVRFERSPAGAGTWSTIDTDTSAPFTASFSTGAVADGYVDLRAVATDASGNVTFSPVATRLVDNTAPTATLATSAASVNSTSTLTVTASDTGTGVASVVLQRAPAGTSLWTTMATLTSAPYTAPFDAAGVPAGRYDVRALVTDNAGNVTTAVLTVTVGGSGLGVSLADPGRTLTGIVNLIATTSGVGATQVSFEIRREGAQAWTSLGADTSAPWSMPLDTTLLRDGRYDVQATVTDGAGSLMHDVRAGVAVDNTAPSVTKSVPVADGRLAGRTVTLTASEALNAVTHVSLDGSATAVPAIKGSAVSFTVGKLRPGRHVLRGTLTDAAGLTAPFSLRFTVPLTAKLGTPSRSRGNVAVPVKISAKATVKARLVSPDGRVVSTRSVTAPKGTVVVALPFPHGASAGRWTVKVTASAGGTSVTKSTGFTVAAKASGTWTIIGR